MASTPRATRASDVPRIARPYTVYRYEPGQDAYSSNLPPLSKASRWWSYRGQLRTVQLETGEYVKSTTRFDNMQAARIRAVVDESREHGVTMPSGYADVFRRRFYSPRIPRTWNAPYLDYLAGGWQAALQPGEHRGRFVLYDLQSAYRWAALEGLPDAATFRATRSLAANGVFLVTLRADADTSALPHPFNTHRTVIASSPEIRAYGLPVDDVLAGVTWRRWIDLNTLTRALDCVTFAKEASRSFWGLWAQRRGVECHAKSGAEWELPPMTTNMIWAHLILSRVRLRTWQAVTPNTVHVFVDSILARAEDRVATGESVGDWRPVKVYWEGVRVEAPGRYGGIFGPLDKAAGIARADRRRLVHGVTPDEYAAIIKRN